MTKTAQVNNSFPIQSVEEYQVNGPSKTEDSDQNAFTDPQTKELLNYIDVRRWYNKYREEGLDHGKAWVKSKANKLPIQDQLTIRREIEDKNPAFYQEAGLHLFSSSAKIEKKSKIDDYWNIVYTNKDIEKLTSNTSG